LAGVLPRVSGFYLEDRIISETTNQPCKSEGCNKFTSQPKETCLQPIMTCKWHRVQQVMDLDRDSHSVSPDR